MFLFIAKPVITLSEQIVHGPVGTDVEVKCMAEAYPAAKIEWYYSSNNPIHVSTKHKIVKYVSLLLFLVKWYYFHCYGFSNMNEHSSTLTIFNVGTKDHQEYFCLSANSLGEAKAYFAGKLLAKNCCSCFWSTVFSIIFVILSLTFLIFLHIIY